jgi:hypothetical protein
VAHPGFAVQQIPSLFRPTAELTFRAQSLAKLNYVVTLEPKGGLRIMKVTLELDEAHARALETLIDRVELELIQRIGTSDRRPTIWSFPWNASGKH